MAYRDPRLEGQCQRVRLTRRECEILSTLTRGGSSKEVAAELFCSKRTVDFHLDRIYRKLQVNNRLQALHKAASLGILQEEAGYAS